MGFCLKTQKYRGIKNKIKSTSTQTGVARVLYREDSSLGSLGAPRSPLLLKSRYMSPPHIYPQRAPPAKARSPLGPQRDRVDAAHRTRRAWTDAGWGEQTHPTPAHIVQVLCLTWPRKGTRTPRGGTCHPGVVSASWAALGTRGRQRRGQRPSGVISRCGERHFDSGRKELVLLC